MRRVAMSIGLLVCIVLCGRAFGQSTYATVGGTIEDSTHALLPGVSVTATNNGTGVVTTVISNESGAYNFASLLPGVYKVSAELPGFQTKAYTDVQLGNAERVRLNFTMSVATQAQSVEVTVAADTLLATSSSSVGEVLAQQRVQDLPMVSNNVLDLYRSMPGIRVNDNGISGSFAGISGLNTVNIVRDGVDNNGGARFGSNALAATYMSPDLIGEVRMIVAPVDAELGRGNAQIQFLTRSGTNQFHGTGVWSVRNSTLDANTWNNNRQVDPKTGAWKPTIPDWANNHQFTASAGGPIKKNRTFLFVLWDSLLVNNRTTQNPVVLTPCARNGIFRYFDGWNNGNFNQALQATGTTPAIAVVDALGNPQRPAANPGADQNPATNPFTGQLRYVSVFGQLLNTPTKPDCSDAVIGPVTGSATGTWDANRKAVDPTGFVAKLMGKMPLPNNYEMGDGLNTAGYRWTRHEKGTEDIFGATVGGLNTLSGPGRKQINTKFDHNFNTRNKVGVSYTYERSTGDANYESWPGGFRGSYFKSPQILSVNFTSTLSPNLVNEARGGMRRSGGNTFNGLTNPETGKEAQTFFPNFAGYPVMIGAGAGSAIAGVNQGVSFSANQPLGGGSTQQYNDITNLWSYGDSLSWTRGKHTFKFGGDVRRTYSLGYDAGITITSIPRANGGDAPLAAIPTAAISSTNMPGLAGTITTGNNVRMRNLLSFLAGSLGSVTQFYYMQNAAKLDKFEDYLTYPQRIRDTRQSEGDLFVKDDWKVLKSLTLNVGLRWEYYGVPYDGGGLMPLPTDGPTAIFGISGRSFDGWMKPGARAGVTSIQFVGKNSTHPDVPFYPNDYNNFGPAVGFAWQLPWLGAGKTTVRGGYQVTYQAGQVANALTQENLVPGSTNNASYTGDSTNTYIDLTKLQSLVPVPNIIKPMQSVPVTDRTQQIFIPQPDLANPYVQNLTLSVTRQIKPNLTVDLRYIGTLGRKQWNAFFNINQPNFLFNGLKEAFDAARAGNDSSPSLQVLENMFKGINVAGANFGPVGTVFNGTLQTAGMHLRALTASCGLGCTINSALANGNYNGVAAGLNTLNYASAFNPTLPAIPAGRNGEVMRYNGFPENFIVTNPQFTNAYMIATVASNNYHSMEAQVTLRPTRGINMQSTYTWSRNTGPGTTYTNPVDRHADYGILSDTRTHDFRTNGAFELPIGPNKLLLSKSTGTLARILENWQAGWIVNVNSGAPTSIAAQNNLYANGTPDIVGPFDPKSAQVTWANGASNGNYFGAGAYSQVKDPQCGNVTTAGGLANLCTLLAITDTKTGQIVLQNPLPGTRGTLGQRALQGPGRWRFDANMSKSIRLTESKALEFRFDATNVLNHPEPSAPIVDINAVNFGLITAAGTTPAKSTLHRQLQGQLRFNF
jgi:hypothetical protein